MFALLCFSGTQPEVTRQRGPDFFFRNARPSASLTRRIDPAVQAKYCVFCALFN